VRFLALTFLFIFSLCRPVRGVLFDIIEAPQDDRQLRESVAKRSDVRRLRQEYNNVEETYLLYLRSSEAPAVFGAKMKEFPQPYVLPAFYWNELILNGLEDVSKPQRRHEDVYSLGQIGYIKLYFLQDGETMENTTICFRPDTAFVPLKSAANISRRLQWEKRKWQLVEAWLKARLPRDLRRDEPFELGPPSQGKSRALEADIRKMWRVVPFPRKDFFVPPVSSIHAAERVFNTVKLEGMPREIVAERLHTELRSPRYNYNAPFWRVGESGQPYPEGSQVFKFDGGGFGLQFTLVYGPDGKVKKIEKQWVNGIM
jgi:hypothetical protein